MDTQTKNRCRTRTASQRRKSSMSQTKTRSNISKQRTSSTLNQKQKKNLAKLLSQNSIDDIVQCFPLTLACRFCGWAKDRGKKKGSIRNITSSTSHSISSKTCESERFNNLKKEGNSDKFRGDFLNENNKGDIKINLKHPIKLTSLFNQGNVPRTMSQVKLLLRDNPTLKTQIKTILGENIIKESMKPISDLFASSDDEVNDTTNSPTATIQTSTNEKVDLEIFPTKVIDCNSSKTGQNSSKNNKKSSEQKKVDRKGREREYINSQGSMFSKLVSTLFGSGKETKPETSEPKRCVRITSGNNYCFNDSIDDNVYKEMRQKYDEWFKNASPRLRERLQWEDFESLIKYYNFISTKTFDQYNAKPKDMPKHFIGDMKSGIDSSYFGEDNHDNKYSCIDKNQNQNAPGADSNHVNAFGKDIDVNKTGGQLEQDRTKCDVINYAQYSCIPFTASKLSAQSITNKALNACPKDTTQSNLGSTLYTLNKQPKVTNRVMEEEESNISLPWMNSETLTTKKLSNNDHGVSNEKYRSNFGNYQYISNLSTLNNKPISSFSDTHKIESKNQIPLLVGPNAESFRSSKANIKINSLKRLKSDDMLNTGSGDVINRLNSLMKELLVVERDKKERNRINSSEITLNKIIPLITKGISNHTRKVSSDKASDTFLKTSSNTEDVSLCQIMCASFVEKLSKHGNKEEGQNMFNSRYSDLPWKNNNFQVYSLPTVSDDNPFMNNNAFKLDHSIERINTENKFQIKESEICISEDYKIVEHENSLVNFTGEIESQVCLSENDSHKQYIQITHFNNDKVFPLSKEESKDSLKNIYAKKDLSDDCLRSVSYCDEYSELSNSRNDDDETTHPDRIMNNTTENTNKFSDDNIDDVMLRLSSVMKELFSSEKDKVDHNDIEKTTEETCHKKERSGSGTTMSCSSFASNFAKPEGGLFPMNGNDFKICCLSTVETENPFKDQGSLKSKNTASEEICFVIADEKGRVVENLDIDLSVPRKYLNASSIPGLLSDTIFNENPERMEESMSANNCLSFLASNETQNTYPVNNEYNHNYNDASCSLSHEINNEHNIPLSFGTEAINSTNLNLGNEALGKFLLEQRIGNITGDLDIESSLLATIPSNSNSILTNLTSTNSSLDDSEIFKEFDESTQTDTQRVEMRKFLKHVVRLAYQNPHWFLRFNDFVLENELSRVSHSNTNCVGIQCKMSEEIYDEQPVKKILLENRLNTSKHQHSFSTFQSVSIREDSETNSSCCNSDKLIPTTSDSGVHSKSFASIERRQFISLPDVLEGAPVIMTNTSEESTKEESERVEHDSSCLNLVISSLSTSVSCQPSKSAEADYYRHLMTDSSSESNSYNPDTEAGKFNTNFETVSVSEKSCSTENTTSSDIDQLKNTSSRLKKILKKMGIKDKKKCEVNPPLRIP